MFNFAERHPNVYYPVMNLGSWDFESGVDLNDALLPQTTQELYEELGEILVHVPVVPLYKRHKVMDFPFVR